jgi:hypothetical protein
MSTNSITRLVIGDLLSMSMEEVEKLYSDGEISIYTYWERKGWFQPPGSPDRIKYRELLSAPD